MIRGTARANFGTGDIAVVSGTTIIDGKVVGCVSFDNQEAREIGETISCKGQITKSSDVQCLFTFTRIESIDSVIEILEDVKKIMREQSEGAQ